MVHLAVLGLLIADEVQEGHEGLAAQLVNQLALPEEHDVSLHLDCFFLLARKHNRQTMVRHA